jgi:polar amino acid transport system permease protein
MEDLLLARPGYLSLLLHGLAVTARLFAVSWVAALVVACLLTAIRATTSKLAQRTVALVVEYHRNVPGLVQIFVWYFGVPQLLPRDWQRWINRNDGEFLMAAIALTLYAAAYMSEDLRSGLRSVSSGQSQAARSLGFTYTQTMRFILLPQALRNALPALVNQTLALFKATSLAMMIGVAELMHAVRQMENETYRTFEAFLIASGCYLAISYLLIYAGSVASRRVAAAKR